VVSAEELLKEALAKDQFNDRVKLLQLQGDEYYSRPYVKFCMRYAPPAVDLEHKWLDIGCGTGGAFSLLPITTAIEPNQSRFLEAEANRNLKTNKCRVSVYQDFAESTGFRSNLFYVVSYLRGFYQCRSDVEALIEINRVLRVGGVFLVDIPTERCIAPAFGKSYVLRDFVTWLRQFGFELLKKGPCDGELHLLAFEKAQHFGADTYNKPQLVKRLDGGPLDTHDHYDLLNPGSWEWWAPKRLRAKPTSKDPVK
jgi:SAM-dependent methyltransferase